MYNLELGPGSLVGIEVLTTRRGEIGVPKGVILAAEMSQNLGVLPIVFLHAGLEIGSAIPYAIHPKSDRDSHALDTQRSPCHLAW